MEDGDTYFSTTCDVRRLPILSRQLTNHLQRRINAEKEGFETEMREGEIERDPKMKTKGKRQVKLSLIRKLSNSDELLIINIQAAVSDSAVSGQSLHDDKTVGIQ